MELEPALLHPIRNNNVAQSVSWVNQIHRCSGLCQPIDGQIARFC